jgi:SAM-dependent methyltransferase
MSLPPNSLILDLGCGSGRHLDDNPKIVDIGVELSIEMCKLCVHRNHPDVVHASGLRLPFRDCTFDHAICVHVLHLLPTEDARIQLMGEVNRVLRIGGDALFTVWGTDVMDGTSQDQIVPWKLKRYAIDPGENLDRFFHYFSQDEFLRIGNHFPFFECLEEVNSDGRIEVRFMRLA